DRAVLNCLLKEKYDPKRDVYFGFNTAALETLRYFRSLGVNTVVDQIDPARYEQKVVDEERLKWPGWEARPGRIPDAYFERLEVEWQRADRIVVTSRGTAAALEWQGVPREKLVIIPLAFELVEPVREPRSAHHRRLTVLWVGSVQLRKGIPYLLEAAR